MIRTICCLVVASLALAAAQAPTSPAPATRNHVVRVVSINQDGLDGSDAEMLAGTLERLERASSFRPDIATLPEVFLRDTVETIPGEVTAKLAAWAQRHSSYLIFGIKTRSGQAIHNSAVLLDRQGRVVGQYDKMYPTEGELRDSVQPGATDPPVFETDFGTIGIQICFDVNWWESWKRLKQKGARIVFFPAAYPADRQLAMLALMNEFYIVSSAHNRHSRIYDITGRELAASGRYERWAAAALPIGKRLFEMDFHRQKVRQIQQKYGSKVEVTWYHEDDWFTLASLAPELTVDDLIAEFGLTPLDAYRDRATKAVESARSTR